jgi:hypothetical protein
MSPRRSVIACAICLEPAGSSSPPCACVRWREEGARLSRLARVALLAAALGEGESITADDMRAAARELES